MPKPLKHAGLALAILAYSISFANCDDSDGSNATKTKEVTVSMAPNPPAEFSLAKLNANHTLLYGLVYKGQAASLQLTKASPDDLDFTRDMIQSNAENDGVTWSFAESTQLLTLNPDKGAIGVDSEATGAPEEITITREDYSTHTIRVRVAKATQPAPTSPSAWDMHKVGGHHRFTFSALGENRLLPVSIPESSKSPTITTEADPAVATAGIEQTDSGWELRIAPSGRGRTSVVLQNPSDENYRATSLRVDIIGVDDAKVDSDGDGLIDIWTLEQLSNIRYSLDGSEYKTSTGAAGSAMGCPENTCNGYELKRSLDFQDDFSYENPTQNKPVWTTNQGWQPIGENLSASFRSVFEGNGHVIYHLYIQRPNEISVGLFGVTVGGIQNIALEELNVSGQERVGGLVGIADSGSTISNSYATGSVSGNERVGGLIGRADTGSTISNSYATGSVSGDSDVGGLVGWASNGSTISNSYATGSVSGNSWIGGLVGWASSGSSISNSYATGSVSGKLRVGGLVGITNSGSTISNSYTTGSVSGNERVGGLVGIADSGSTISNSYTTGSVSGNRRVGGLVGWAPSGSSTRGSSISNSYATGSVSGNSDVGGLVGITSSGSTISNSYATGAVSGKLRVGGLVGNSLSTISNSYATGAVSGEKGYAYIGGLVGAFDGDLRNSYAIGDVTGHVYIGGLVGIIYRSASIENSYARGDVSGTARVGALVGSNSATIRNSYATGTVKSSHDHGPAKKLVTDNRGSIQNSCGSGGDGSLLAFMKSSTAHTTLSYLPSWYCFDAEGGTLSSGMITLFHDWDKARYVESSLGSSRKVWNFDHRTLAGSPNSHNFTPTLNSSSATPDDSRFRPGLQYIHQELGLWRLKNGNEDVHPLYIEENAQNTYTLPHPEGVVVARPELGTNGLFPGVPVGYTVNVKWDTASGDYKGASSSDPGASIPDTVGFLQYASERTIKVVKDTEPLLATIAASEEGTYKVFLRGLITIKQGKTTIQSYNYDFPFLMK